MADVVMLVCTACGQGNCLRVGRLADAPKCGTCGTALIDGRVAELDPRLHDKASRSDGLPLPVDYWAPWRGPCRAMAPELAKAAAQLAPRARSAKINTEDHFEISRHLGIRGIPLLILWHQGRELARLASARPAADIAAFIRQSLPHSA